MFRVKALSAEDFDFAVQLTDKKSWDLTREDFEFMVKLEPEGCFLLLSDSRRVGIVTSVSFGRTAWFGNLIVDEPYQRKGAGSMLVIHLTEYLKARKAETIGLFSYMDAVAFYEKLGFKRDVDFVVLKRKATALGKEYHATRARRSDLKQIIDFDQSCFPGNRIKLIEPLILNPKNLCFISAEDGRMFGYLVAKVYDGAAELGPLVCRQADSLAAIDLIKAGLDALEGIQVSIYLAKTENEVVRTLKASGFREDFCVARMFMGRPFVLECIYGAESLERG